MAERHGHIRLNGSYYAIDLGSYKVRDITDFAPRAAVPGGSLYHSELGLYQPIVQKDWRHGFGFPNWSDEMGYQRTQGSIDTRHGVLMLMTSPIKSDTVASGTYRGFVEAFGDVWAWGSTGIRRFTSSAASWGSVDVNVGTQVNWMWTDGINIFAALDAGRLFSASSGSIASTAAWTIRGAGDSSIDYHWLGHHDGFFYAIKQGTNLEGNEVYFSDSYLFADLLGDPSDDPNAIIVGLTGQQVERGQSYQSGFFFQRPDGMYKMDADRGGAEIIVDYKSIQSTANFRASAVHNGVMVYTIADRIKAWNGAKESDITPGAVGRADAVTGVLNDQFPYTTYGYFNNFAVRDNALFMSARVNESTAGDDIIGFDGIGWHKAYDADTVTNASVIEAMYVDAVNNRLWFAERDGSTDFQVKYISFQAQSPYPSSPFPTANTHSLFMSRLDAGFRWVTKSTPTLDVEIENPSSGIRGTAIYYALNEATSFTAWGGSTTTNFVDTVGVTRLRNPLNDTSGFSTLEYKSLRLRLDVVTNADSASPIVKSLTTRLIMRPDEAYGYSFSVIAAKFYQYGMESEPDDRRAIDIIRNLRTARASKAPVRFYDIHGSEMRVYVSSINEQAVEEHADDAFDQDIANVEHRVFVNLVQVSS